MKNTIDRILVVNDEPDMKNMFETIFSINVEAELFKRYSGIFKEKASEEMTGNSQPEKYALFYSDNGQDGIDLIKSNMDENRVFSLVFIDIQMNESNCIKTAHLIHEVDPDIEIILLTSAAFSSEYVNKLANYDKVYFLSKPFTANEILLLTRTLCCTRRNKIEKIQIDNQLQRCEAWSNLADNPKENSVIKINKQGKIIYWNQPAEQLTGYQSNEVLQKDISEIIILNNKTSFQKERREQARRIETLNLAFEAGRSQCSTMALHNIGNSLTPILLYLEKLKKLELTKTSHYLTCCRKELSDMQIPDSNSADQVAHAKNINTFMKDLLTELDERINLSNEIQDMIKTNIDEIRKTLTFQQIYLPRQNENKEIVSINMLLNDLISIRQSSFFKRGISLKQEFYENLPGILVEKTSFMQVMANLIQNSINAIDQTKNLKKPQIELRTSLVDKFVQLSILDNGCGIEPEMLETISAMEFINEKNSGFGLPFCKHFIETNKGFLKLESDGNNCGTVLILALPVASKKKIHCPENN